MNIDKEGPCWNKIDRPTGSRVRPSKNPRVHVYAMSTAVLTDLISRVVCHHFTYTVLDEL